jgi:hypothetical protein
VAIGTFCGLLLSHGVPPTPISVNKCIIFIWIRKEPRRSYLILLGFAAEI